MPHARNIKPGFYKNEDLAECSVWARLLFPGLWMLADREGRLEDRPKRIKGELFPFDSVEVEPLLQELSRWKFIERYEVGGRRFIQVLRFLEHQRPHGTEKDSPIPDRDGFVTVHDRSKNGCISGTWHKTKPDHGDLTVRPPLNHALNPDSLIPESGSYRQQDATTVWPPSHGEPPDEPDPAPEPNHETPPSGENPPPPAPNADAITARAVAIAVLLRQRGAGVAAGDVRLRAWAQRGVTDAALLTALETSERRRASACSPQPVNAGLLDSILAEPPPGRARGGGRQAARDAYLASAQASATQHGLGEGSEHGRYERDITGHCARVA